MLFYVLNPKTVVFVLNPKGRLSWQDHDCTEVTMMLLLLNTAALMLTSTM